MTLQVRRFNARAIAAYPPVEGDPQERLTMVLTD